MLAHGLEERCYKIFIQIRKNLQVQQSHQNTRSSFTELEENTRINIKADPKVQIDLEDIMLNKLRHSMRKPCKFPPIRDCYKYQVEDRIQSYLLGSRGEEGHAELEEGAHS